MEVFLRSMREREREREVGREGEREREILKYILSYQETIVKESYSTDTTVTLADNILHTIRCSYQYFYRYTCNIMEQLSVEKTKAHDNGKYGKNYVQILNIGFV